MMMMMMMMINRELTELISLVIHPSNIDIGLLTTTKQCLHILHYAVQ